MVRGHSCPPCQPGAAMGSGGQWQAGRRVLRGSAPPTPPGGLGLRLQQERKHVKHSGQAPEPGMPLPFFFPWSLSLLFSLGFSSSAGRLWKAIAGVLVEGLRGRRIVSIEYGTAHDGAAPRGHGRGTQGGGRRDGAGLFPVRSIPGF